MLGPVQDFSLALGAHLAGITFTAALMGKEFSDPGQHIVQVNRVIKNHHRTGPNRTGDLLEIFKSEGNVKVLGFQKGSGGATRQNALQLSSLKQATCQVIDQVAQRYSKRHFVNTGPNNRTTDGKQLCAGRLVGPERSIPGPAVYNN